MYLVLNDIFGEAYVVWSHLRDINDVDSQLEFIEVVNADSLENKYRPTKSHFQAAIELFNAPRNYRVLAHTMVMILFGQMCGVNGILYYISDLMEGPS